MNHNLKLYTIATLAILSTGCKVGKEYVRPATDLPTQYRAAQQATDSISVAALSTKVFFNDPALQQLIDSANTKNYDLLIALKNIEQADQTLREAKVNFLPELGLNIQANSSKPSKNSLNGLSMGQFLGTSTVQDYNTALNLSWEIGLWGKLRGMKAQALSQYLQTQEASKLIRSKLVSTVATGYYNLLMLDEQLRIANRTVSLNDSTLRMTKLQWEAGLTTILAIQQAEAQKLSSEQLIPALLQNISIQENALSQLTGTLPASVYRLKKLNEISPAVQMPAGYPVALLNQRADVKASEYALRAANEAIGIAQASMYPSLNITAQGGLNSFKASNWFNIPGSLFGMVAGSVAQPIFQRRQLKTKFEIAKLEREKSVLAFRQTVLLAVTEVADALTTSARLKEQLVLAEARVNTLRSAIKNADMLYKSGMATYLEVILAQGSLLQSELELSDLKRQRLAADVTLYTALGGGNNPE
ncbi:efflux transporter outer membrane subunit [Pedobacter gandavensis]|uniref:Efflux transporter outer membrane subunit n=1 Tax=Pedobacter gandavensis TaxID=2679963 RepID=A0ABR6EUL0_9SPHI|nr:efflux transporter outer membrane subunit [Pedobacter gandavensis]MBB2148737.1 efflux transporter outer membrane subunit [Pedobacter gandavensis]